jgi:hypothetical protein
MFLYAMPWSALHGMLGAWALWPSAPGGRAGLRAAAATVILGAGVFTVPLVGLPEYATTTNALHCRALGFTGARPSADCEPEEVARGAAVARDGGSLYTARERLGVHGFNLLLAAGGWLVGLDEVAWETAALSVLPNPLPADATTEQRRAQCRASYSAAATRAASLAEPLTRRSDFPMRSARVRSAVADGAARLGPEPGSELDLGELHFVSGSTNVDAYSGALVGDSLRVALALEVGDSRLALRRRPDKAIEVTWTGTIHYPDADIAFAVPLPLPWGPPVLRVSEAVFCGMHVDGAMNPYPLTYTWTLSPSDPRIGADRDRPERGPFEAALLAVAGWVGVRLGAG